MKRPILTYRSLFSQLLWMIEPPVCIAAVSEEGHTNIARHADRQAAMDIEVSPLDSTGQLLI